MAKKIVTFSFLTIGLLLLSLFFTKQSQIQSVYMGLPTVPCFDNTKPVLQSYSFNIVITVDGKNIPLSSKLGHDYGNCLHAIYVNDSSGKVIVRANDTKQYNLGQFFDVWRVAFSPTQLMSFRTDEKHLLKVYVNGSEVKTFRDTLLKADEIIKVVYQ